jgi:hypothetical protein
MFDAWEHYMNLVTNPEDWVCMMDGDIAFLNADFGHHMQEYINKYPDTGIFTCYASRSRTTWMMPDKHIFNSTNILDHKKKADHHAAKCRLDVVEIDNRVTGHLMMMKKDTWNKIKDAASQKCDDLSILSVDSRISRSVLAIGMKIRLMKGIYVFHYYRHLEGANSKSHLQ